MARTKAISLIQSGSTKVDLAELSGLVISNIQKDTLSQGLKSQAYTGNPASGSVEFKRFKNSASQPYGTARTAGKGDAITVPPTTVNLNTHKEIVEEAAKFDLDTFGVGNIMARRADNHVDTVASEFDTAFFAQAKAEGTSYTPASDAGIEDLLEGIIQTLESVKNDYVRGVPRNMIRLVLDPLTYGKARNYLDKSTNNANVDTAAEDFAIFHGVRVYSSINLPVTSEATSDSKTKTTTVHAISIIQAIQKARDSKTPVRFLITGTDLECNIRMGIESFEYEERSGELGDLYYTIKLYEWKDTSPKKIVLPEKKNTPAKTQEPARAGKPEKKSKTYTVKKGDCLWNIAKKFYGKGSDYTKIYNANKGTIGKNPNLIYPGQVFTIP